LISAKKGKKASVELSVNFLVVIIISLIVMGIGFFLVREMIGQGEDTMKGLDLRTQKQIENLLRSSDDPISIPYIQKTIPEGDDAVFGVGVLNLEKSAGPTDTFSVYVDLVKYVKPDGTVVLPPFSGATPEILPGFDLANDGKFKDIGKNEVGIFSVPIDVPKRTPSGEYVFDVYICKSNTCSSSGLFYDGTIHKIYVKVP
jgi:hypothetical protein